MMNKSGRRGRRPGSPATREQILEVARRRFLSEGYQRVTMRSIAAEAGVDVALLSYFFGSKQGLWGAALALVANPVQIMDAALPGDPRSLPERLLQALISTWDDPKRGQSLRELVRAAASEPAVGQLLREVVEREMIDRLAQHLGGFDARRRAAAVGVQLAGVIFARYVLALDPIAGMTADELARRLAPGLRAVLRPDRPVT